MEHKDWQRIKDVPTPDQRREQILAASRHFAHYLRINPNQDHYIWVSMSRCPVRIKDFGKLATSWDLKKWLLAKGAEPYTWDENRCCWLREGRPLIHYTEIFPKLLYTIRHSRYKDYNVIYNLARSQYHVDRNDIKVALHIWHQYELDNIPIDDESVWKLAATFDYFARNARLRSINVDRMKSVNGNINSGGDMDLNQGAKLNKGVSDQASVDAPLPKPEQAEHPLTTQNQPQKHPRNFRGEELLDPLPERIGSPDRVLTVQYFCRCCLENVKNLPCSTLHSVQ